MKVSVKKRESVIPVEIKTDFIKLEAVMKLSHAFSGGTAKYLIQDGEVSVNGEVCTMRGKKLFPGDRFCFDNQDYVICSHEAK